MNIDLSFWSKVDATGDCWLWRTGGRRSDGYATFQRSGRNILAHRHAWEMLVGPIDDGMTLDHLCRVRHCVNPDHLEPITLKDNILRGAGPPALNARKTHCVRGHPLDVTPNKRGQRICKRCDRERKSMNKQRSYQ